MTASVGFGPLWPIDGPPPIRPMFGLEQAAEAPAAGVRIVTDLDDRSIPRWVNGAEVYPYPPDTPDIFDACAPESERSKGFGASIESPAFGAITVYIAETCTSYKVWDQAAFKARAVAALTAVESAGIAYHFMSGAGLIDNPHLADGNGEFPNGDTATTSVDALALLEDEIAQSARLGLIHCTPMFATSLLGRGFAVKDTTGVIRTINGNVVIPDAGYAIARRAGSHPSGHAAPTAREEWVYATGPIDIRRDDLFTSPDDVSEALDRGTPDGASTGRPNSITYRAERYYLVACDMEVQAAVLADRCLDSCGIGGS